MTVWRGVTRLATSSLLRRAIHNLPTFSDYGGGEIEESSAGVSKTGDTVTSGGKGVGANQVSARGERPVLGLSDKRFVVAIFVKNGSPTLSSVCSW